MEFLKAALTQTPYVNSRGCIRLHIEVNHWSKEKQFLFMVRTPMDISTSHGYIELARTPIPKDPIYAHRAMRERVLRNYLEIIAMRYDRPYKLRSYTAFKRLVQHDWRGL